MTTTHYHSKIAIFIKTVLFVVTTDTYLNVVFIILTARKKRSFINLACLKERNDFDAVFKARPRFFVIKVSSVSLVGSLKVPKLYVYTPFSPFRVPRFLFVVSYLISISGHVSLGVIVWKFKVYALLRSNNVLIDVDIS